MQARRVPLNQLSLGVQCRCMCHVIESCHATMWNKCMHARERRLLNQLSKETFKSAEHNGI